MDEIKIDTDSTDSQFFLVRLIFAALCVLLELYLKLMTALNSREYWEPAHMLDLVELADDLWTVGSFRDSATRTHLIILRISKFAFSNIASEVLEIACECA